VNRIALHQSTVHPMDPLRQVEVVREAGIDSIGLRVAAPGVDPADPEEWWSHGLGSPMLHRLIEALLASRVTVLDVGRVHLGPELRVVDGRHGYVRALEIGVRLGAQFVTARLPDDPTDDPAELFGLLSGLGSRYGLRATLPPQVPVAIGAAPADPPGAPGPVRDDHVAAVAALRAAVDAMLRHPQASPAH